MPLTKKSKCQLTPNCVLIFPLGGGAKEDDYEKEKRVTSNFAHIVPFRWLKKFKKKLPQKARRRQ